MKVLIRIRRGVDSMRILKWLKGIAGGVKVVASIDDTPFGQRMIGALPGGSPFMALANLAAALVVKAEVAYSDMEKAGPHKERLALTLAEGEPSEKVIAKIEAETGRRFVPGQEANFALATQMEVKVHALLSNCFSGFDVPPSDPGKR
jgi:hypothetical protein